MDKKTIYAMKNAFDEIVKIIQEEAVEFWYARDLMALLGYDRWENFHKAIERAIDSCKASEIEPADHFRSVTKMVQIGSGAERAVKDYMLTRYACYLIAQNGDPRKEEIAFAQSYFAVQTRKQELIEQRQEESFVNQKRDYRKIYMNEVWMMLDLVVLDQEVTRHYLVASLRRK